MVPLVLYVSGEKGVMDRDGRNVWTLRAYSIPLSWVSLAFLLGIVVIFSSPTSSHIDASEYTLSMMRNAISNSRIPTRLSIYSNLVMESTSTRGYDHICLGNMATIWKVALRRSDQVFNRLDNWWRGGNAEKDGSHLSPRCRRNCQPHFTRQKPV